MVIGSAPFAVYKTMFPHKVTARCIFGPKNPPIAMPRNLLVLALAAFLLARCASPTAPQGGPRDEQPPRVAPEKSTDNYQTNFHPVEIELTFDEWVKLQDVGRQIIISPPLQGYTARLKGKTVILDLGNQDTLRDNATYVIQFGEAVQDLTESNPAEDLRFVFSTGPAIDSLEIQGQVVDAYTNEPVEKVLVMLYDNLADSVVRTERPFYFARTDEEGRFRISNIREGDFKIFALEDADANYRFNQAGERIAFRPEPININPDSVPPLSLRLFAEALPLQRIRVDTSTMGRVKVAFNQDPSIMLQVDTRGVEALTAYQQDSLLVWTRQPDRWPLYLRTDSLYRDTLRIPAVDAEQVQTILPPLEALAPIGRGGKQPPSGPVAVGFNLPLVAVDTSQVQLLSDTTLTPVPYTWRIDTLDPRQLLINASWRENLPYQLLLLPGAATDPYGRSLADTVQRNFVIDEAKRFGILNINITNADTTKAYLIRLVNNNDRLLHSFQIFDQAQDSRTFNLLPPGDYRLEIIEDRNRNGRWDAGHYNSQRRPEPVRRRTLEALRANWELDATVDIGDLFRD